MLRVLLIIFLLAMNCLPGNCQGLALIPGQVAHERVAKLTSAMTWYTSLAQAENAARREGKMVLWIHMLGDIKGAT
jgi:hypothetical protein